MSLKCYYTSTSGHQEHPPRGQDTGSSARTPPGQTCKRCLTMLMNIILGEGASIGNFSEYCKRNRQTSSLAHLSWNSTPDGVLLVSIVVGLASSILALFRTYATSARSQFLLKIFLNVKKYF